MSFDPRAKVLELLQWIKEQGLWPENCSEDSLWVVPISNTIKRYRDLQPQHRAIALWIPSGEELRKVLEKKGYEGLELDEKDGIFFVKIGTPSKKPAHGVGIGHREALLSALNQMRKEVA